MFNLIENICIKTEGFHVGVVCGTTRALFLSGLIEQSKGHVTLILFDENATQFLGTPKVEKT